MLKAIDKACTLQCLLPDHLRLLHVSGKQGKHTNRKETMHNSFHQWLPDVGCSLDWVTGSLKNSKGCMHVQSKNSKAKVSGVLLVPVSSNDASLHIGHLHLHCSSMMRHVLRRNIMVIILDLCKQYVGL